MGLALKILIPVVVFWLTIGLAGYIKDRRKRRRIPPSQLPVKNS
jgi:hypothetical protein